MFNKVCYILIGGLLIANICVANARVKSDFKIDIIKEEVVKNEVLIRSNVQEIHDTVEPVVAENAPTMKEWVLDEVMKNGLDPKYVDRLIMCESTWNDKAVSKTGDVGLWQINMRWHPEIPEDCLLDYKCNTKEAIKIVQDWNGYGAWTCSKYEKY